MQALILACGLVVFSEHNSLPSGAIYSFSDLARMKKLSSLTPAEKLLVNEVQYINLFTAINSTVDPAHSCPGHKVKINEQEFILKQLSARAVCGSLRGTEPLRTAFLSAFCR